MNEYPLIEEKVIGYRVYKLYDEIYGSYYSRHPCPDIGVKTKCWTNSNPFHAFRTINDILTVTGRYCTLIEEVDLK